MFHLFRLRVIQSAFRMPNRLQAISKIVSSTVIHRIRSIFPIPTGYLEKAANTQIFAKQCPLPPQKIIKESLLHKRAAFFLIVYKNCISAPREKHRYADDQKPVPPSPQYHHQSSFSRARCICAFLPASFLGMTTCDLCSR